MIAPVVADKKGLDIVIEGERISRPYVEMTVRMMRDFGINVRPTQEGFRVYPGTYRAKEFYRVEADASAASYFLALGALTGDMSIMAQANVASPTTARTAMGSNSVSKSVVQNVNINNKFEGDRAGQQKSAAAMDKAAGDSTGEMARALAYAR